MHQIRHPHRPGRLLSGLRLLLLGLLATQLVACATAPAPPGVDPSGGPAQAAQGEAVRWWYVRFRLARDADDEVDSHLDGLIADRLLAPVIGRHAADLPLWRFHRRWPRDATGHQFSFIFQAAPAVARGVTGEIERAPLLARLQADGHLVEYRVDASDPVRGADPAATSDPSWSPSIQREWPKFIMGASRMWLGLVQAAAADHPEAGLYQRYREAEQALNALWFSEGNHAFFHHLSALFGYRPLRVIRRDIMTF